MMPDPRDVENARSDSELEELRGRIGNLYTRMGLSPPSQLYTAVKHWLGLSHEEILAAIEDHFAQHRRLYVSGSGDGYFYLVEAAIRKAWQAKHPTRDRADDASERPQRKRRGVQRVHNAGGGPHDLLLDDPRAVRVLRKRNQTAAVERPSTMRGYAGAGVPIGEDDEADA